MKIVHLSDLHLSGFSFMPEWGESVIKLVNSLSADMVIVTGDLTDDGYKYEYDIAITYLRRIEVENKLVLPGNHDARNEGYRLFEGIFGTRFPWYEDNSVVIQGIDSSQPDIEDGHIGRGNYSTIQGRLNDRGKVRILALHHHLIPIPGTGRERDIPVDAGDVLKLCIESEVNFVFSGHKHVPWVWKLGDTYFVTAGTSTTRRLKGGGYPSFNLPWIVE